MQQSVSRIFYCVVILLNLHILLSWRTQISNNFPFSRFQLKFSNNINELIKINRKEQIQRLQEYYETKNVNEFTVLLRSLAVSNPELFQQRSQIDCIDMSFTKDKSFIDRLSSRQISEWLYSFSQLAEKLRFSFHFSSTNEEFYLYLIHNLSQRSNKLTTTQVTKSIGSLKLLKFNFNAQTSQVKGNILYLLDQVAGILDERGISSLLHSVANIELSWDDTPIETQNKFITSLMKLNKKCNDERSNIHSAMLIHSLGKLGMNINILSEEMKSQVYMVAMIILNKATTQAQDSNIARQVSNVIWGLAKMGCQCNNFPETISKTMVDAITIRASDMNEQEISNVIYS